MAVKNQPSGDGGMGESMRGSMEPLTSVRLAKGQADRIDWLLRNGMAPGKDRSETVRVLVEQGLQELLAQITALQDRIQQAEEAGHVPPALQSHPWYAALSSLPPGKRRRT